jgi:hypothetical protein
MLQPRDTKEIETLLRRAFEVDRILPPVFRKTTGCTLGAMVVIPDDLRSLEDLTEDAARDWRNLTQEDLNIWSEALEWLPKLKTPQREVVKKRCQGKSWKRISRELYQEKATSRELERTSLWRIFHDGLDRILTNY